MIIVFIIKILYELKNNRIEVLRTFRSYKMSKLFIRVDLFHIFINS